MHALHTVKYHPFIKSQLASRKLRCLMWGENGHVTPHHLGPTNPSYSTVWHSCNLVVPAFGEFGRCETLGWNSHLPHRTPVPLCVCVWPCGRGRLCGWVYWQHCRICHISSTLQSCVLSTSTECSHRVGSKIGTNPIGRRSYSAQIPPPLYFWPEPHTLFFSLLTSARFSPQSHPFTWTWSWTSRFPELLNFILKDSLKFSPRTNVFRSAASLFPIYIYIYNIYIYAYI